MQNIAQFWSDQFLSSVLKLIKGLPRVVLGRKRVRKIQVDNGSETAIQLT